MNTQRMHQLADAIEKAGVYDMTHPGNVDKAFGMGDWVDDLSVLSEVINAPADERVDHALECGFAGCAAGWATVLADIKLTDGSQAVVVFKEWLDVTPAEARYFCHAFWYDDEVDMNLISGWIVAEALRLWADTGSLHDCVPNNDAGLWPHELVARDQHTWIKAVITDDFFSTTLEREFAQTVIALQLDLPL